MSNKRFHMFFVFLISVLVLLSGCKSMFTEEGRFFSQGKSAAKSRRYDVAVENLVRAVNIDREYKKAILLLEETYPQGIDYYRAELRKIEGKGDLPSLDYRASLYTALVNMSRSIKEVPTLTHPKTEKPVVFPVYDYDAEKEEAVLAAAEGHYQEGIRLAAQGEREANKAASKEFLKVLDYIPGYKDASARELSARSGASQQLLFLPFRGESYFYTTLDVNEYLLDYIQSELLEDREALEYTTVVDRSVLDLALEEQKLHLTGLFDEAQSIEIGKMVSANMVFTGTVTQVDGEKPRRQVVNDDRLKTVAATEVDLGRLPEEGETVSVKGYVEVHTLTSSARLLAGFKLIDIETGTVLIHKTYQVDREDSARWLVLEGDKRVLSEEEKALLTAADREVMDVDEMLMECVQEVGQKMADELGAYLR